MEGKKIMGDVCPILRECGFFDGIEEENYTDVLNCLKASRKSYQKGDTILREGDCSQLAGIVMRGVVGLSFLDEEGNLVNIKHVSRCEVFGIERACSDAGTSPMQLDAVTDCEVLFMDFSSLLSVKSPLCIHRTRVISNLLRNFAQQTLHLQYHLRVLSQRRLRDKIKVYLQTQMVESDGTIHLPFKRDELANYLYTDRSALSRELSKMCREGLIASKGQTIRILDTEFFYS